MAAGAAPAMTDYQLLIVGGGLTGLTLAHALAGCCPNRRFGLIEQRQRLANSSDDPRLLALARHSVALLHQWQLWSSVRGSASPIQSIEVSDRGHLGLARLGGDGQPFGYVVAAGALAAQFGRQLEQTLIDDAVVAIAREVDRVVVTLAGGRQLSCQLLVLADGGSRQWDQTLGQQRQFSAYPAEALITLVNSDRPHHGRAYERFTEAGPLALLPVGERQFSLVWCGSGDDCRQRLTADEAQFNAALQQAVGYRAGRLMLAAPRQSYPLKLMTVERLMSHRVLWLGNAAHTLHPVAGQGFNLALRDIEALVRLLGNEGHDWGQYSLLAAYERQREADIAATVRFTDGLLALFANRHWPLVVGRNLGLMALNRWPWGQQTITRQGMGLAGGG